MIERLAEDHVNARRLAEGLAELDGIVSAGGSAQPAPGRLDPDRIRTNFVMFKVERDRAAFLAALRARGVEMVEYPHGQVRAVTHYGVTAADIETTIVATRAALADTRPTIPASAAPEPSSPTPDRAGDPQPVRPTSQPRGPQPVTDPRPAAPFPRPARAAVPGPLDDRLYDLVETRFVRLVRDNPVFATAVGLHHDDDLLGDGSRDALLGELADEREHLAEVEAIDSAGLSSEAAFERDLEIHNVRRAIFDHAELRIWERRSFALDHVGDGLFLLFARDHAPLPERLDAIAGRLEAVATYLEEAKTRATVPQVRRWQQVEIDTAGELPVFFDEIVAAGEGVLPAGEQRRLSRASESAKVAIDLYTAWLEGTLEHGTDDWAIGRERHDEMVALRAFDGLDADAILELGWQRLAEERTARAAAAREIDPDADEIAVIDAVKGNHPATFDGGPRGLSRVHAARPRRT